ncbi:ribbon-helix-helix domain-containing protein [Devosia sp. XJ19-1]|uniref:Ribbon-helix-helix domain-containing protein n=1 Tax=Devosia ureilytica TaxID=2952754 RepID=A0A9Q4AMY2_9HYPH|nr:ribbon-helix-helix domain-containing protein [Devosia ureilytica]MCP8883012.1 ribbon-helix-helix domain-containing protein [Devosia ureilytica]MCP8886620.1 ribbon-helix-helix domain-containing protein [Devosia ureilytica]
MKSKLDTAPALDERISLVLPLDLKARLFEIASRKRLPASHVVREAIHHYTIEHAA